METKGWGRDAFPDTDLLIISKEICELKYTWIVNFKAAANQNVWKQSQVVCTVHEYFLTQKWIFYLFVFIAFQGPLLSDQGPEQSGCLILMQTSWLYFSNLLLGLEPAVCILNKHPGDCKAI